MTLEEKIQAALQERAAREADALLASAVNIAVNLHQERLKGILWEARKELATILEAQLRETLTHAAIHAAISEALAGQTKSRGGGRKGKDLEQHNREVDALSREVEQRLDLKA